MVNKTYQLPYIQDVLYKNKIISHKYFLATFFLQIHA